MGWNTPAFPVLHHLLEFAQIHVHWISDAIQPSHPLLLLPSIFPSTRVFSNEEPLCIRLPKDWSFSFSVSPSHDWKILPKGWFPSGWYDHRLFIYLLAHMLSHTHMWSHLCVRPCRLKLEGTQFSLRDLTSWVSWRTDTYKCVCVCVCVCVCACVRAHTHTELKFVFLLFKIPHSSNSNDWTRTKEQMHTNTQV